MRKALAIDLIDLKEVISTVKLGDLFPGVTGPRFGWVCDELKLGSQGVGEVDLRVVYTKDGKQQIREFTYLGSYFVHWTAEKAEDG